MIFLTKGQRLYDNPGMVIYDQTGYYEDGDSVICATVSFPEEPVCRYEAKFIAYGSMVYSIADPDELLEEVKKINPDTLFGKTNADKVASDIVDNIQMADSQNPTTENVDIAPETPPQEATSTPQVETPPDTTTPPVDVSTTTPTTTIPDLTNASSTPPVSDIGAILDDVSKLSDTIDSVVDTNAATASASTTP